MAKRIDPATLELKEVTVATNRVSKTVKGVTLVSASTMEKAFAGYGGNMEAAKQIGKTIAERALEKGITEVVFDRGGNLYHGRVKELAEAAREGGLKF